ncbi:unnamed protein product [Bemisia tabaci]|uniref:Uncharacterized protein n=1 Tax=Bemisia tabaci TaxID=7038 RepID=A0A9P0CCH8_BEMTA|nr:unnamed protein product [Bemisia tabaci]
MEIFFTVITISSLSILTCFASDTSNDAIPSDVMENPVENSGEEIMKTAENVIFRPYFQHPTHHHHGAHHHSHHGNQHTNSQPAVVSLENVNPGKDSTLESNLVRRSYAVVYPNPRPTWYATGSPPNSIYYGPYPSPSSAPNYPAQPRNCYCYPQTSYQKSEDRYNPNYYNRLANYYNNYYKQYSQS